ncbi:MAG TPA: alpha/beta fold hydrolase [Candidatus Binatia bacterium]|nr:alpha/beta fold hydrolase [Candidatus Binatia bacterium]
MRIALLAPVGTLVLSTLLLSAPARAQDACLTGDSTLGDQRALAALGDATEAACPCADAASGKTYQRCAKNVLSQILADGTLRPECEKTAKAIVCGTSCGANTVPCGIVPVGARDDATGCKLARPKSCENARRALQTACTDETSCDDVVTWTAGTCFDPRDEGPYSPGVKVMSWTKDSAASPGTPRTLDTVVWYPAPKGSGPIDSSYRAVVDAPLEPTGGPYPVVLFSHGSCGYPLQSTFLTPLLASRGFIVVAPPHPGNTIFEFPTCGTTNAQVQSFIERPKDMSFVLDQILAAGRDPSSPFFGAVDGSRVAMTGHSFGGLTTFLVAAQDPRVGVAVAMAPATPTNAKLTIPSLIMLGNIDSVVNLPAARQAYAASSTPKMLVEIEHAGYYAFSNGCFPSPDCNPPTTLTQAEANADVLRYVVPFLERYLALDVALVPLLGPPTAARDSSIKPNCDTRLGRVRGSLRSARAVPQFVKLCRVG